MIDKILISCNKYSFFQDIIGYSWFRIKGKVFIFLSFQKLLMLFCFIVLDLKGKKERSTFLPSGNKVDYSIELLNNHFGNDQANTNARLVLFFTLYWSIQLKQSFLISLFDANAIVVNWYLQQVILLIFITEYLENSHNYETLLLGELHSIRQQIQ